MLLLALGIIVVVGTVAGLFVLLFKRDVGGSALMALGLVGILAGAIIPSLAAVSHILINVGSGRTINMDFQQAVNTVQTKATQVTGDASQVRQLTKDVKEMRDNIQLAYRTLFETLVFEFDTRNEFPPPQSIIDELNRRLNILGDFAYGSEQARIAAVQAINRAIVQAHQASAAATPTPAK